MAAFDAVQRVDRRPVPWDLDRPAHVLLGVVTARVRAVACSADPQGSMRLWRSNAPGSARNGATGRPQATMG